MTNCVFQFCDVRTGFLKMGSPSHKGSEYLPPPPPIVPPNVVPLQSGKVAAPAPKRLPMARRNHGTKGTPMTLLTNHFEVRMRQTEGYFCHYSVIYLCSLSRFSHWFLPSASVANTLILYMVLLLIYCYRLLYFMKMVILLMGKVSGEKFLTKFRRHIVMSLKVNTLLMMGRRACSLLALFNVRSLSSRLWWKTSLRIGIYVCIDML